MAIKGKTKIRVVISPKAPAPAFKPIAGYLAIDKTCGGYPYTTQTVENSASFEFNEAHAFVQEFLDAVAAGRQDQVLSSSTGIFNWGYEVNTVASFIRTMIRDNGLNIRDVQVVLEIGELSFVSLETKIVNHVMLDQAEVEKQKRLAQYLELKKEFEQ